MENSHHQPVQTLSLQIVRGRHIISEVKPSPIDNDSDNFLPS